MVDFTPDVARQNTVKAVISDLANLAPGDMIPFDTLRASYGFDPQRGEGYRVVYEARMKLLREEGAAFRVRPNEGVVRLHDKDTLYDESRRKRIGGQVRRRGSELDGVDYTSLDADDQRVWAVERVRNEAVRQAVSGKVGKPALNPTAPGKSLLAALKPSK